MGLPVLLELFIFDLFRFAWLLLSLVFISYLFLQLISMLLQQFFTLFLKLLLNFSQLLLFIHCGLKLWLLRFSLLFKSSFFLELLFKSSSLQLFCFLCSHLCFNSIFFSGSSLICLYSSFSSQCIKLSLPIWCLFLQFSELLNIFFLLLFDSSK